MSVLTPPSQIAQRQLNYFTGKHVLVAGEIEDDFPLYLTDHCEKVSVFTTHYGYYRHIAQHKDIDSYFGAQLTQPCHADLLLLYWPKAKKEADYLLSMLLCHLGDKTEIVVVGENRSGIKSIEKLFKPYGIINKYDSARRCSLYWGECQKSPSSFHIEHWFKEYDIDFNGIVLKIKSLPGVFSHGEFDLGSQLLIKNLPDLNGKVLDFGCGAGVLGCIMAAKNHHIDLHLCDVNALAVASTQETLKANAFSGNVFATDIYVNTASDYDWIISNPPFHSGLDTNYNATETLLENAPSHLNHQGKLIIVANSFLKYPPIIKHSFGHCNTLDKTNKFTIYQAIKSS